MSLLDLPAELVLSVAEILESERDLNAFTRTNYHLYNILNPYLYRHNVQQCGSLALLWAANYGQKGTAQKLLEEGADVETSDGYFTPLLLAAANGHAEVVKLLLEKNAYTESKDTYHRTPLFLTVTYEHKAVVKLLLADDRIYPDSQAENGQTPLSEAAEKGYEVMVKLLLADRRAYTNSMD